MKNGKFRLYQLAFLIPGISPLLASSRKQIRQMPKALKYPCVRPQRQHRWTVLVLNFGFLAAFTIRALRAMLFELLITNFQYPMKC